MAGNDPSRSHLAKFQDTLTSKVGPDTPGRRSSPEIDVVPAGPPLEVRLGDLDQRLGSCEMRIEGVYERLAKLERERSDNVGQKQRLTRVIFLWVGLVTLFIVIWTFMGPGGR
jgi:hypothetical protein